MTAVTFRLRCRVSIAAVFIICFTELEKLELSCFSRLLPRGDISKSFNFFSDYLSAETSDEHLQKNTLSSSPPKKTSLISFISRDDFYSRMIVAVERRGRVWEGREREREREMGGTRKKKGGGLVSYLIKKVASAASNRRKKSQFRSRVSKKRSKVWHLATDSGKFLCVQTSWEKKSYLEYGVGWDKGKGDVFWNCDIYLNKRNRL